MFGKDKPAVDESIGALEIVHTFDDAMPTGVSVSHTGRIFVCFPKWGDKVEFTVGEIRDGKLIAFPDQAFNDNESDADPNHLVSVQSIVVDPATGCGCSTPAAPCSSPSAPAAPSWCAST